jgi:hypothetical protein
LKKPPKAGDDIYYIAKKIVLGQLSEKEQEGALLEVSFLMINVYREIY